MKAVVAPAVQIGQSLGDYEVVAPLKAGGMATLYLARRRGPAGFARHVAIKVVHPHLAADPTFVKMFLDEARLSARIQHPNVVHVEDLGEADGHYYLVMQYVHGCNLAQLMGALGRRRLAMTPALAVHVAMAVAEGLHAAHEASSDDGELLGVVHRDVSPQNILLSRAGQVKLIDFGVAKARGRKMQTSTGSLKGKLRYMAPEQAWGRAVDRRTDIFALGVVLWEMLAHRRLFQGDNDIAVLEAVRNPQVPPPSSFRQGVPPNLDAAVGQALSADLTERFQTARALRKALGNAMPGAREVDPDDVAALVEEVMGDRLDADVQRLPESVSGVVRAGAAPVVGEDRREAVLHTMTCFDPDVQVEFDEPDSEPGVAAPLAAPPARPRPARTRWPLLLAVTGGVIAGVAGTWAVSSRMGARGPDGGEGTAREAVGSQSQPGAAPVDPDGGRAGPDAGGVPRVAAHGTADAGAAQPGSATEDVDGTARAKAERRGRERDPSPMAPRVTGDMRPDMDPIAIPFVDDVEF